MSRNDGVRMGAGGQVMQEIVEEPKPTETLTKKEDKEVQVLEERLVEMPVEEESEEQEDEKL